MKQKIDANLVRSCMAFAKYKHASEIIPRKRQTRLAFDVKALHSLGNRCVIQLQVNKSYNVSITLESQGHSITTWTRILRSGTRYSTRDHWIQESIKRIFNSELLWAVGATQKKPKLPHVKFESSVFAFDFNPSKA